MNIIKIVEGLSKNFVTEIKLENGIIKFPFPIQQEGYFSKNKNTLLTDCVEDYTLFIEKDEELVVCGHLSQLLSTSLKIRQEAIGYTELIALPKEIGRALVHPFNDSYTNSKDYFQKSLQNKISEIENAISENIIPQDFIMYAEKLISKMIEQLKE